jgi:hypothetical protein
LRWSIPDAQAKVGSHDDGRKFAAASPEAVGGLLHSVFRNVSVLRNVHRDQLGERTNCYFSAGDGQLPFAEGWPKLKRWSA